MHILQIRLWNGFTFALLETALIVDTILNYMYIYACFRPVFIGHPHSQVIGSIGAGREYECEGLNNCTWVQFRSGQWRWTISFL